MLRLKSVFSLTSYLLTLTYLLMVRRRLMSLAAHTDLQIALGICTDLELRSSSPAHNLTFMLKYINVYEEKNAEEM